MLQYTLQTRETVSIVARENVYLANELGLRWLFACFFLSLSIILPGAKLGGRVLQRKELATCPKNAIAEEGAFSKMLPDTCLKHGTQICF